ncbi:hypothetical protein DSBG_1546 [Desulfosporosinus sp. BG]|nr:hypothetical protein DSBG_1546 [Desulfosporosinus sp. BG]
MVFLLENGEYGGKCQSSWSRQKAILDEKAAIRKVMPILKWTAKSNLE